jgi:hypothetical protein
MALRGSTVVIGLLAVLLLAGCAPAPPMPDVDDVVGTWDHHGPGDNLATLTFESDGTFVGQGIPIDLFDRLVDPKLDWRQTVDIEGTWFIGGRHGLDPYLAFNIARSSQLPSFYTYLETEQSADGFQLYYVVGDIDDDNRFRFVRE